MQFMVVLITATTVLIVTHPNIYYHCDAQFFNPQNYLDQLPSLKMPYVNNVPIPNIPLVHIIKPTPAITTKVINVVTKYVARNPVCIKSTGKKKPRCKRDASSATKHNANDHLITKEYFVHNRVAKESRAEMEEAQYKKLKQEIAAYKNLVKIGAFNRSATTASTTIHGSEPSQAHPTEETRYHRVARAVRDADGDGLGVAEATPELHARKLIKAGAGMVAAEKLKDLLIEDRLDRLEDMLPHYTRMRVYQTSTITVTRTRMERMATATLMVKNCVPDGIDYCKKSQKTASSGGGNKKKKRKSKVAVEQSPAIPNYTPYYYG